MAGHQGQAETQDGGEQIHGAVSLLIREGKGKGAPPRAASGPL